MKRQFARHCILLLASVTWPILLTPFIGADSLPPLKVNVNSYVTGSWNGVLFVIDDSTGFQVRVGTKVDGGNYIDGDGAKPNATGFTSTTLNGLYEAVTVVGPHAPDGSYSELTWNPRFPYDKGSRFRFEWTRLDSSTLLGKITYTAPIDYMNENRKADVVLEAYSPLGFKAEYKVHEGTASAHAEYVPVLAEVEWNQWKFNFSSEGISQPQQIEPGSAAGFWKEDFDDSSWKIVRWGSYWQEDPFINMKGYGWYRTRIVIPAEMKGKVVRLDLGKIREKDWSYLNGEAVGETAGSDIDRLYLIEPGSSAYAKIHWGAANEIAVQVFSASELGGISSGPYQYLPAMLGGRLLPPPRPRLQMLASKKKIANFVLVAGRKVDQSASYQDVNDLSDAMQRDGKLASSNGSGAAGLLFSGLHEGNFKGPRDNELYFVCKVGSEEINVLRAQSQAILDQGDIGELLQAARTKYQARRVTTQGGIAGAAEMITNEMQWAEIYAPEQKRSFVVDSRRWFLPDRWTLFGNSAVLSARSVSLENKTLAENTLMGILRESLPDGRVMNGAGKAITTPDRSEDMYAAYSAWKIYQQWGDLNFLTETYPFIKKWHEWWFADRGDGQPWRDGNRDGLLELGSNMSPFDTPQSPRDSEDYGIHHQGAMWESGYDDNPMWGYYENGLDMHPPQYRGEKNVQFVYKTQTLNMNLTETSALWALSADMLTRIAHELGKTEDERQFHLEYEGIKKRINEVLWDDSTGMYLNRFWPEYGGQFSYRKSPVMFYMLAAGVPSQAQAHRLIYEHMLNPKEFWGENVLPTISRDDPAYPEQYYWRGNVWPPTNYFSYEGLKRYGYDDVAAQLAEKTYQLVKKNWDTTGALWENYNSITGQGDPRGAGGSTKHYTWSAALPLIAIMECIDSEAWGKGLRFGSVGLSQESRVRHLRIRDADYDVTVGPEITSLQKNGHALFVAPISMVVRDFEQSPRLVSFHYKTESNKGDFLGSLGGLFLRDGVLPSIHVDGQVVLSGVRLGSDTVAVNLPAGEHAVLVEVVP